MRSHTHRRGGFTLAVGQAFQPDTVGQAFQPDAARSVRLESLTYRRRGGFTLVELLVVMGILAALFAMTAFMLNSSFMTSQNVSRNADQVSGWLLSARQMARRDQVPTGIRFTVTGNVCREVRYIRQPDDYALGTFIGRLDDTTNTHIARISSGSNLTDPNIFPVQAGDYFEVYGGGILRRITAAPTAEGSNVYRLTLALAPPADTGVPLPPSVALTDLGAGGPPTNYRIIAQPRPISGEPALEIKNDICIDFNARSYAVPTNSALSNPPVRAGQYEILFGPSGAVIGQGTGSGMIYLWVRELRPDGKPDNTSDRLAGRPVLITIQTRTGVIATHPVRPQGDPYQFARDGRASGM